MNSSSLRVLFFLRCVIYLLQHLFSFYGLIWDFFYLSLSLSMCIKMKEVSSQQLKTLVNVDVRERQAMCLSPYVQLGLLSLFSIYSAFFYES